MTPTPYPRPLAGIPDPIFIQGRYSWAKLYCGDCRLIAPTLEGVDACVSDPPYGISHSSSHGASWANTKIRNDHNAELRDTMWSFYAELPRAMCGTWKVPPPSNCRGVLVYDKGHAGSGDLDFPWKPSWEEIYVAGNGWAGKRDSGILSGPQMTTWETGPGHNGKGGRLHPHEKPVWLMAALVAKLPNAKVIVDPFMGSGPTGVACAQLHRNFYGIEEDPHHFGNAVKRIRDELESILL